MNLEENNFQKALYKYPAARSSAPHYTVHTFAGTVDQSEAVQDAKIKKKKNVNVSSLSPPVAPDMAVRSYSNNINKSNTSR
ncbi:hypothetical protein MRX96_048265 [Rhipicephalus microplus]